MNQEVKALKLEISELKEELARLRLDFSKLERLVRERDSGESEGSFSVVSSVPLAGPSGPAATSAAAAGQQVPAQTSERVGYVWEERVTYSVPRGPTISWEERLEIAAEVGRFLSRAAGGDHRGSSGRERIPFASRLWVVVRSISGVTFDPVRVFGKWSLAKNLVKIGSEVGDSVFVGLPSQREVERALSAGGFRWEGLIEA